MGLAKVWKWRLLRFEGVGVAKVWGGTGQRLGGA